MYLKPFSRDFFRDRPTEFPADWCCRSLRFDEPNNHGPFSLVGCEYNREPLNTFADDTITDLVMVYGSQAKKTGTLMGAAAWLCVNVGTRIFWVMPTLSLAQKFSRTRLMKMLRASDATRPLVPTGADRHDFKTLELRLGPSIIDLCGSNSPANLSSTPAPVVFQDETEKFDTGTTEADASDLADQRTKNVCNPKRVKTSTPAMVDGLIWQNLIKTDIRRRHLPCPGCGKFVVLAWSPTFTTFKLTGDEAFVAWDKEAKRDDGWDLDRVMNSARAECPHCGFHIRDQHKLVADKLGEWRATATAAAGFRGYHLPSLYASTPETTFGRLAVKFLQAKRSLQGLQGFINGDLAEPFENQDTRSNRTELVTAPDAPPLPDSVPIMTVDHQKLAPFFWSTVMSCAKSGSIRLLWAGSCNEWEDLEEIQKHFGIRDVHVAIDQQYQPDEVQTNCLKHGAPFPRTMQWVGWVPIIGRDGAFTMLDRATKSVRPVALGPNPITVGSGGERLFPLYINGEWFLHPLNRLRKNQVAGRTFEVCRFNDLTKIAGAAPIDEQEFFRHLDAKVYVGRTVGRTGKTEWRWEKRSRHWPDHLLDCITYGLGMAMFHGRLPFSEDDNKPNT